MANQFSRNLSKNVKMGNSYRFHTKKQWLGPAKPGYINYFDEISKERKIKTDDNRFSIIQDAMKLILSGSDTPMQALEKLNKKWGYRTRKTERQGGKPLSRSAWYRILADPYYYGLMVRKEGEETGNHKPMISADEFQRLQFILGRKGRPHISRHDLPYKGPLKCGKCGGSVTAEERWQVVCTKCKTKFHKSKNRNECPNCGLLIEEMKNPKIYHHIHYVCVKTKKGLCKQSAVNIKEIEKTIESELDKFEISEHLKNWAIKYLNELNTSETTDREKVRINLEEAKSDCIKRLDGLVKLKISPQNTNGDVLSDDEYTSQRKVILSEKDSLERELTRVDERMSRWHELSVKTFNFACYARYWFANGDVKTKTQILETLGSNLIINDRKLLIDGQKAFFLIKKGKQEVLAEAKKFEPAKYLDIMANLDSYEPLRTAWLWVRDSNPDTQIQNLQSYH